MNILIVEDEIIVAETIKKIFKGLDNINLIDITDKFDEAYNKASSKVYDVVLVDVMLKEKRNGIDLCSLIRQNNPNIILIVITCMTSIEYLKEAFKVGVNDYITKPFNRKELELRVNRWQQFSVNDVKVCDTIEYYELHYSIIKNRFYFNNEQLNLTKKNKELLLLFLKNPEMILSADFLQEKLWGDYYISLRNRNIRSNIQILRSVLKDHCGNWIETIRGEGYVLQKPENNGK